MPPDKITEIKNGLFEQMQLAAENPYHYRKSLYLEHLELGHRRLVWKNYKIIYRVEMGYVIVTDVFHARQDPAQMRG